jgi:quercetin dioxygenase-like cupin family protein
MVYLLRGQLHYHLSEEEYLLSEGDTLFYHDDVAHSWVNVGDDMAVLLTLSTADGRDER